MHIKSFWRNLLHPLPRRRSLAGLLLAAGLIPLLLTVTACLKAPIGNPETARVDPKLAGVWLGEKAEEKEEALFIFRPYDKRTYLVSWFDLSKGARLEEENNAADPAKDPNAKVNFIIFKGWLTDLAGKRFICLESVYQISKERGMKPEHWLAFQVDLQGDRLTLHMVDGRDAGDTTRQIEGFLRRKIKDGTLRYDDPMKFQRVAQSDYDKVANLLKRAGFETD